MIILTGFRKYGKYSYNLSNDIVKNFKVNFKDTIIKRVSLPVSWRESIEVYRDILLLKEPNPKLAILLGIHSNNSISIEKFAWNFALGTDITNKAKFGFIRFGSKLHISTILDVKKIYSTLKDKMKIQISYTPGLFLCNYIYYWALHLASNRYPVIFIHLPYNGKLDEYIKKIEIIIRLIMKL
ncbi:MAG: hypothetical protein ACFFAN_14080 [Promethearchaeota archaeon]